MIDHVVTSGTFTLDGQSFDVDNNIWLVGDDAEVFVVDAAHEAQPIIDAVRGRKVVAVVATHGHNDHINVATAVADAVGAPILIHPDDLMLWEVVNPGRQPDGLLHDGDELVGRRRHPEGAAHPGPLPRRVLPLRRGRRRGVQRRHAVQRRPRGHRALLQRPAHHRALDHREAADAARRHRRAHRPRRLHHHRRRARQRHPRGLTPPRSLQPDQIRPRADGPRSAICARAHRAGCRARPRGRHRPAWPGTSPRRPSASATRAPSAEPAAGAGHADAHADGHRLGADRQGPAELLDDAVGDLLGHPEGVVAADQHGELVATEAGDGVLAAHGRGQAGAR